MNQADEDFKDFVLDQLRRVREAVCKPMFGGYGLYAGERFFGIIAEGKLYFKTDAGSRDRYKSLGMKPFRTNAKQTLKNYYEVPAGVFEDEEKIAEWAQRAAQID